MTHIDPQDVSQAIDKLIFDLDNIATILKQRHPTYRDILTIVDCYSYGMSLMTTCLMIDEYLTSNTKFKACHNIKNLLTLLIQTDIRMNSVLALDIVKAIKNNAGTIHWSAFDQLPHVTMI